VSVRPAELTLPTSCAVVGCHGAIGSAVVARLHALGVEVHGFDIAEGPAERLASFTLLPAQSAEAAVARFAERAGELQAASLVVASGVYPARQISEETVSSLQDVLTVNAVVPALLVRSFVEATQHAASVVVTSSLAALRPRIGTAAYSTSKVALERLLEAVGLEYRDHGVRINVVRPGYVASQSAVNPIPESYDARMKAAGASSEPEDLVETFLWLLSENSRQVHGSVVAVDRGMHLGSSSEKAWLG
jgi:NAD(P)-dependent dehydrogenase (short-subunit alcohol dehydrogenase family)